MNSKDFSTIIKEIKEKNPTLELDSIVEKYEKIKNCYEDNENKMKVRDDIKKEIKKLKKNLNKIDDNFYIRFIAIMIKASNIILEVDFFPGILCQAQDSLLFPLQVSAHPE